jgi:periodic tryptophan protein 1
MLTTMCWVPLGAMRKVPLRSAAAAEEAKAELRKRHGLGEDGDDEATAEGRQNLDSDNDDDDPVYKQGAGNVIEQIASDDEDELDDITYKDTDLVFVTARASDDPHFEVYVYDDPDDSLYMHHDVALSAFPLSSTWMSDGATSLVAIGTMLPYVEIWSLDELDPVAPVLVLGGCDKPERNYKRKIKREWLKPESHTDAVVSMQWNRREQHILATGSADQTIKLWDLLQGTCVGTYRENGRVQATEWHPTEGNLLLSCCSSELSIRDCRNPQAAAARWEVPNDTIENVRWDMHSGHVFASTSGGMICAFEARMNGNRVWQVNAHGEETVFDISPHAPLLAAGGKDGSLSLWDLRSTPTAPLVSRDLRIGQAFSVQFHPNCPHVLGACGSEGQPLVYTISNDLAQAGFQF